MDSRMWGEGIVRWMDLRGGRQGGRGAEPSRRGALVRSGTVRAAGQSFPQGIHVPGAVIPIMFVQGPIGEDVVRVVQADGDQVPLAHALGQRDAVGHGSDGTTRALKDAKGGLRSRFRLVQNIAGRLPPRRELGEFDGHY